MVEASKTKYILVFILYMIVNALLIKLLAVPLATSIYESLGVTTISMLIATIMEIIFLLFSFYIIFTNFNDIKISKIFPLYLFFLAFALIVNGITYYALLDPIGFGNIYIVCILIQGATMIYCITNYSKKINRWD